MDDFGPVVLEDEIIGEKTEMEISVLLNENCTLPMINASLALSPRQAILKHLTRLAIHKKIGSNDQDRAIILNDYVTALSHISEFIVYLVCKNFWENDRRPFLPFIDEIKEACSLVQEKIEKLKSSKKERIEEKMPICKIEKKKEKLTYQQKHRNDWTFEDWDEYVSEAKKMLILAEKNPSMFDVNGWKETIKRREEEKEEKMKNNG